MADKKKSKEIKKAVKEHYGKAIKLKVENTHGSRCSPDPVKFNREAAERFVKLAGYTPSELADLPHNVSSFGCGNPVSLMRVKPGQTVLDLGSGSGLDLILAAKKVGDNGYVIGLDMTEEMIEVCKNNISMAGIKNAEVRKGEMEKMPVDDNSIDWIISNCVVNLSPDKKQVFSEAFRVLRPGGEVMISDIVTIDLIDELRNDMKAWVGCVAGALDEDQFVRLMSEAGFEQIRIVDKVIYEGDSLAAFAGGGCCSGLESESDTEAEKFSGKIASVMVNAKKPK